MAAFEYQALDERGRRKKGVLSGDTPRQVRQQLREQNLTPTLVQEVQGRGPARGRRRRRISPTQLAVITRQFSTLVGAGISVEDALKGLVEQTEILHIRSTLSGVRSLVLEGETLARAVGAFPGAFPDIYRASILAGEQSGKLAMVLERLADFSEASQGLRQRLNRALIYPGFLLGASTLIVVFLFTYVMPKIVRVFEDTGRDLPLLTRTFIAISEFLQQYGLALLVGLVLGAGVLWLFFRRPAPRFALHGALLNAPWLRRLVRGLNTTRMARTLSIMTRSGVPLLTAMDATAEVIGNLVMRRALRDAASEVGEGVPLNRALSRSGLFPPMLVQMVASGEASGTLDDMLDKAATAQEREFEGRLGMLMDLFEPLMILVMGAIVLVIVLAILLPIFDINQLIA